MYCSNFKMFGLLPAWESLSKFSFEFWPNPPILEFNVETWELEQCNNYQSFNLNPNYLATYFPDLCGHILRIDCGNGPLDIIVTNSNLGGGLDLYSTSTWPKATNNQPPGEAHCSVQLTNINPVSGKILCIFMLALESQCIKYILQSHGHKTLGTICITQLSDMGKLCPQFLDLALYYVKLSSEDYLFV